MLLHLFFYVYFLIVSVLYIHVYSNKIWLNKTVRPFRASDCPTFIHVIRLASHQSVQLYYYCLHVGLNKMSCSRQYMVKKMVKVKLERVMSDMNLVLKRKQEAIKDNKKNKVQFQMFYMILSRLALPNLTVILKD